MQTVEETIEVAVPATTRIWVRLEWSPENLAERAGAALGFDNMQVRADLLRFKEFMETRRSGTDA